MSKTKNNNFLIAKFGEKEHLEQLKSGNIFFNSIQTYRNDGTDYRGDYMEGKIPINPKTIKTIYSSGNNLFENIPYPDHVVEYILDDEDLLMFCAATITTKIMVPNEKNIWFFNENFKAAVNHFGEYVLLLSTTELLEHIKNSVDPTGQKIGYSAGMILYRNLDDFEHTDEYRKTGSPLDRYFVKSQSYENQNEWRVIIDGETKPISLNYGTGFLLKTYPFEFATIMKTSIFLNSPIQIPQ